MKTTAHKGLIVGGPFLLAIILLTGCGGGGASPVTVEPSTAPATVSAIPSAPASTAAPTATDKPIPAVTVTKTVTSSPTSTSAPEDASPSPEATAEDGVDDGIGAFGSTATYDDGLAVTISAPKVYHPSDPFENKFAHYVVVTITVKNGSKAIFDPSMVTISASSGGEQAPNNYDFEDPTTKVLPGKSITWKTGLNVKDAKSLTVEFAPDFDTDSGIWTNDR